MHYIIAGSRHVTTVHVPVLAAMFKLHRNDLMRTPGGIRHGTRGLWKHRYAWACAGVKSTHDGGVTLQ